MDRGLGDGSRVGSGQNCLGERFFPAFRVIRTARMRSWPRFCAQLLRCMSYRNDGLIHVIRWNENGATNRLARKAGSAIPGK